MESLLWLNLRRARSAVAYSIALANMLTPRLKGVRMPVSTTSFAERFFGRSSNRRGTKREGMFATCPWGQEGKGAVYCYECHEELLHNPVLLPEDIRAFSALVRIRKLDEEQKPEHREKIAGRVSLLHEVIASGLDVMLRREHAEK